MEQAGGGVEGMLDVRAMGDDSIVVVDKEAGGANSAWPPWKHLLEASLPLSCSYPPRQSGKTIDFHSPSHLTPPLVTAVHTLSLTFTVPSASPPPGHRCSSERSTSHYTSPDPTISISSTPLDLLA
jgi:hypothetical protein